MRILTIIFLFCGFGAIAQPVVYQGNAAQTTGFKGGVLSDSGYYHPNIKGADTVLVGVRPTGNGKEFGITFQALASRIGGIIGVPGLQTVLSTSSTLTQNNVITHFGYDLTFRGTKFIVKPDTSEWYGMTIMQDHPIRYLNSLPPVTDRDLPDYGFVKNLITKISFDSVMSTTVTSLTSIRFTEPFSLVCYGGMCWNSDYFTQNLLTGVISFSFPFYLGQKLTFKK